MEVVRPITCTRGSGPRRVGEVGIALPEVPLPAAQLARGTGGSRRLAIAAPSGAVDFVTSPGSWAFRWYLILVSWQENLSNRGDRGCRESRSSRTAGDDPPGGDLGRLDRGLPRPRPDDPQEALDRRRLLSPRRPFPLDHPGGGGVLVLLPGTALALIACLRRRRRPPGLASWDCCRSSDSST